VCARVHYGRLLSINLRKHPSYDVKNIFYVLLNIIILISRRRLTAAARVVRPSSYSRRLSGVGAHTSRIINRLGNFIIIITATRIPFRLLRRRRRRRFISETDSELFRTRAFAPSFGPENIRSCVDACVSVRTCAYVNISFRSVCSHLHTHTPVYAQFAYNIQ